VMSKAQLSLRYAVSPHQPHFHKRLWLLAAVASASCCFFPACVNLSPPWNKPPLGDAGAADRMVFAPAPGRDGAAADTAGLGLAEVGRDLAADVEPGAGRAEVGSDAPAVPDAVSPLAGNSGEYLSAVSLAEA